MDCCVGLEVVIAARIAPFTLPILLPIDGLEDGRFDIFSVVWDGCDVACVSRGLCSKVAYKIIPIIAQMAIMSVYSTHPKLRLSELIVPYFYRER
jgi:hypothetical protein